MPWEGPDADANKDNPNYKYQYHPGGDPNNAPKDAPGALHSHTIMGMLHNVCLFDLSLTSYSASLPADLHEKYNKSIE